MTSPMTMGEKIGNSSFGGADTNVGTFGVRSLLQGERFQVLDRRQAYYECTQHNSRLFDFDGRVINTGALGTQPTLSQEQARWVPFKLRRPSSPYRLPKVIVNSLTNMTFGEQRFPSFRVMGAPKTQDWIQTVARVGQLPVRMIHARNIGGAVGTVGISWGFVEGKPRFQVHNGKHLFVHSWEDRDQLIPEHVSEVYLFTKHEWVQEKKKFETRWYWYRRDWTPDMDVVFKPVLFQNNIEPTFEPDLSKSVAHDDGITHFEWIQNLPSSDIDGIPDYDGLYETFDTLDILLSVIMRGATLNLDPTLVLKMDLDYVQRMGLKKGSDHALTVGEEGDAHYLEMGGTSITAGLQLFNDTRRYALEVAQCVVADPDKLAAAGTSSVALKAIYSPMLGKTDILREQYGTPMSRMMERMNRVAGAMKGKTVTVMVNGQPEERELVIILPPKVTRKPKEEVTEEDSDELPDEPDAEGSDVIIEERDPGTGGEVDAKWGPYFMPTPSDISAQATAMQVATGGKQFVSQQSAAESLALMTGHEPDEEWDRIQREHEKHEEKTNAMFADASGAMGGQVSHSKDLPDGSTVRRNAQLGAPEEEETGDEDASVGKPAVTPQDASAIITVNEARESMGLEPLAADGELTLAEFKTKHADNVAKAANANLGKVGEPADANPPPPPSFGGPPGAGGGKPPFGKPPGAPGGAPPFGQSKSPTPAGKPPSGAPGGPPSPFPPKKPFPPK